MSFVNSGFSKILTAYEVTGVVCGVRVENVEDPLMREIRYLDKLVDELAKGYVLLPGFELLILVQLLNRCL